LYSGFVKSDLLGAGLLTLDGAHSCYIHNLLRPAFSEVKKMEGG